MATADGPGMLGDFKTSSVGIALVDANHRLVSVNLHLCEMLGRSSKELIGMRFEEFTHHDDVDLDAHLATRLLAGELESYEMRKRFMTKAGRTISANLTASVVRDARGTILHGVAIVTPVHASAWNAAPAPRTEAADIERVRRAMLDCETE